MATIKVIKIDNYSKVIVIDKNSNNQGDIYSRFINSLKEAKIISTDYNKISFLVSDICIVYNINNEDVIYDDIIKFNDIYQHKLNKCNVKLILLNKYDNKVYNINNVIVCHSKLIKSIMSLGLFEDIINSLVSYSKFKGNIQYYINEIIRELMICICNENKLNVRCFKITKENIKQFIEKDSLHINKINSINYLDKTVIILDYKQDNKHYQKVNNNSIIFYDVKNNDAI